MRDYLSVCNDRIKELIMQVRRTDLTYNTRMKYMTIITIDAHGVAIVDEFKSKNPPIESDSFDW